MVQQPPVRHGLLIIETSSSHSDTPQLVGPSGRGIGPTQRPVPDNTQHTQATAIYPPRWDSNPQSQQASGPDPCHRPRSDRDRQKNNITALMLSLYLEVRLVRYEVYIYF